MADVKITIDIDADTAAIDRVRSKLKALCREVDDCTQTHEKHTAALRDLSKAQKDNEDGSNKNTKKMSTLGKMAKGLSGFLKKLAMFGFKYLAIEAAAALVVIGSAGLLFKAGSMLAKGYQASLGAISYAMAGVVAAGAAFLASQRQFQQVQFAPMYSEGAVNTESSIVAASQAMSMFVEDSQMAVIGAKGLSSAFKTLSDQAPVTGKTTAVFRELSNYTAGMGGDMEKNSQAMAKFLAKFQKDKTLTEGVTTAGKELGPGFEKILKEAKKKGLNTYDKFAEAAMKGELGDTFKKYSGQLDTLNNTVIGKFKQSFSEIKSLLTDIGDPLLAPITNAIPRIKNIIEALLLRIRGNVQSIGSGSLLDGLVSAFEKGARLVGRMAGGDLGKAGSVFSGMRKAWDGIVSGFEKVQDYLRPLLAASSVLWDTLEPIFDAFGNNLDSSIQQLSDSLVDNKESWVGFGTAIGTFLTTVGSVGTMIKEVFIDLMPTLSDSLNLFSEIISASIPAFKVLLSLLKPIFWTINMILKAIMKIASIIDAVLNPIISVLTLGLLDVKNVVKSLTAAVLLLGAAMIASYAKGGVVKKAVKFIQDGGVQDAAKKGKKVAKYGKKGGNALMRGGRALAGKVAPRLASIGGGSAAAGASIAAGSAAAGYFTGGFVSDKLFNADTKKSRAGGALAGAASGGAAGAAVGAGIGALFGGVGAGPGAIAGAIIGSIAGGISGYLKAGKERRVAKKAAGEILKSYSQGMDKAIKSGDIDALKKSAEKANEDLLGLEGSSKYGAQEIKKRRKEIESLNKQVDNYVTNASNFEMFAGMDADKMNELLGKKGGKGVDAAKNEILNIFEIMRQGGIDVSSRWRQVMGDFNQQLLEARLSMFDNKITAIETADAVNAAQQKLLEGDTSEKSVTEFLKKSYEYALGQTGGDATAATALMKDTLDTAYGPGGSLNKVADVVRDQADKLRLFDPQVLIDQMSASGKLQTQGRAIETISGGKIGAGVAEVQIQKLVSGAGKDGAAMSSKIDKIMQAYMSGRITAEQLQASLFSSDVMGSTLGQITSQDNMNKGRVDEKGRTGFGATSTTVTPDSAAMQNIDIGGVTVQVSGLIKDKGTAEMIAKEVQKAIAEHEARKGKKK